MQQRDARPRLTNQTNPANKADNLNFLWFLENYEYLKQAYSGEWVAIHQQRLMAHSSNYIELIDEIKKLKINRPFVTRVTPEFLGVIWE